MIEKKDIEHLSKLARIEVTDSEAEGLKKDINSILSYVEQVGKVSSGDDDTPSVLPWHNVLREDKNSDETEEYSQEIIKSFPDSENGYLKVKKIL